MRPADIFPCGRTGASSRPTRRSAAGPGTSPDELVGRRLHDFLNIAGRIFYETHFAPLLRMQGFFDEVALDLVKKDGEPFPVLVNAAERKNSEGKPRFIRLTVFNATDRRRYERELLKARDELKMLTATLEKRVAEAAADQLRSDPALARNGPKPSFVNNSSLFWGTTSATRLRRSLRGYAAHSEVEAGRAGRGSRHHDAKERRCGWRA